VIGENSYIYEVKLCWINCEKFNVKMKSASVIEIQDWLNASFQQKILDQDIKIS
jgi:hypothetical protein